MNFYFPWEEAMLLGIQEHVRNDFLTPIFKFITHLADKGIIWLCISLVLLIVPAMMLKFGTPNVRQQKNLRVLFTIGIMCVIGFILTFAVNHVLLKHAVDRTRPYELISGLELLVSPADDASFPSGHSAISFTIATILMFQLPKKFGIPAMVLAALIAFSRLYVGIHFPTDVIFGAISGFVFGCIAIVLGNAFTRFLKARRFPGFIWN